MFLGDCFFFVCSAPLRRVDVFFPASLGILSPISRDIFKPFLSHCKYALSMPISSAAARAC